MPDTKITTCKDKGKYKSPSGRVYTAEQVRYYYANGGSFEKKDKK